MQKINFENLPSTSTPLNATNLNQLQTNIENAINNILISEGIPVGTIHTYAGSTAPTGYMICNGSAVSRTTYSDLFDVIGTTYGNGNGSTTFNIPNLKGKVPIGYDSTDNDFDTLGETGGEKTHTLTTTEMPSHSHQNPHYVVGSNAPGYGNWEQNIGSGSSNAYLASAYSLETGGGQAHNNLQPYIVLNYIIKY